MARTIEAETDRLHADAAKAFPMWETTKDVVDEFIDLALNYRQSGHPGGSRSKVHLLLALMLATGGVALVLGKGAPAIGVGLGELSALAAAVFAATSANVIRAMRSTDNAATIFFFFCLAGLPVVLPFALDPWPSAPWAWGVALVVGLAAFAAQLLMTEAYGTLAVSEAAAWLQLTPIAQYVLAWPVLGERPTAAGLAGAVLAVVGVAYGTALGHRARRAASHTEAPGASEPHG